MLKSTLYSQKVRLDGKDEREKYIVSEVSRRGKTLGPQPLRIALRIQPGYLRTHGHALDQRHSGGSESISGLRNGTARALQHDYVGVSDVDEAGRF